MQHALCDLQYVDIHSQDPDCIALLHALTHKVHGFNKAHGSNPLGLDFPAWNGHCAPTQEAMLRLRLWGSASALGDFLRQPQVARLRVAGLVFEAARDTQEAASYSQLKRDIAGRQRSAAYRRRFEARNGRPLEKTTRHNFSMAIPTHSRSTSTPFVLAITKRDLTEVPEHVEFNSYGLTLQGGLPQL